MKRISRLNKSSCLGFDCKVFYESSIYMVNAQEFPDTQQDFSEKTLGTESSKKYTSSIVKLNRFGRNTNAVVGNTLLCKLPVH